MKSFYSLLIIFFSFTAVVAQTLHVDSTRFITGVNPTTQFNFAIPTLDRGMLLVGHECCSAGGIIPATGYSGENVLIVKIDSEQKISWIKIYGGNGDDAASCAIQTPDGGFAILGGTVSTDGDVVGFIGGSSDIWLTRIDTAGNLLWSKCYGSTESDVGISIANTPDRGFILLGLTNGSDHDIPFHYGSTFLTDWAVIKTDSLGNEQWSKDMGGSADEGFGSVLAAGNGYYIAGTSASIDHDCTDTTWHPAIPGTGTGNNFYLLRLDSSGNKQWDSSYGGSHSDAVSYAIQDTRDSSIVIVGTTTSNDYMVVGLHGCPDDASDIWMVKLTTNGTMLWNKAIGSRQEEYGRSVCARQGNGYMVLGTTRPEACVDSIGDIGNQDCWLFALDSSGNVISDKVFGGTDADEPYSVVPYLNGYVVAGNSISPSFTEGTTYGNFDTSGAESGGAFVSYISFGTLAVRNIGVSNDLNLAVYPNPSRDIVRIHTPAENGIVTLKDIFGRTIFTKKVSQQNQFLDIDVALWASGMYIVNWQGAETYLQAKLIKK